ncbi:MAG: exodeoxyribonuclease V subunit gamma [Methylococcales bacterium]|nr:exodeoxyribonuclease V subunit gamma [Methylococcales bacterium]MDD5754482.1 exodeoxyribonuclease V subunit gamma [Methylococcales bacterium]
MFILHSSNKTENLVAHMALVIKTLPLSSPFRKEIFLIQSQGMERWLSQQLAQTFQIWANYEFLFPAKFFSSVAQKLDSRLNDAAFDRHKMTWRIENVLRELDDDDFLPLQQYLSSENPELKRYQLAQELAQLFDQYQMMRPDLLTAWQENKLVYDTAAERWQKALWRNITKQIGTQHRGALWQKVINQLLDADENFYADKLPERVIVFGINTMPPLFLAFLHGLSKHCQLHLFLLNPSQDYWADIPSKRSRLKQTPEEQYDSHPLLSSLGQQGREFQVLLLEQNLAIDLDVDTFESADGATVLQRLQNDLLNNEAGKYELKPDDSIQIHACHSRMREVEVLKNQLIHALEHDATLELRDIVVMSPGIQNYEPFISAVFHDIHHTIADRSLRLSNHALDIFIRFLHVSQSRFGWQSVLDLLAQPMVHTHFDLSETDLELIRHWVKDTQVRWGKSGDHKAELDLPNLDANTWQAMLNRLFMGYAVGDDSNFVQDILPYPHIEGSTALALGGLNDFLQLLFTASDNFKTAQSLNNWRNSLYDYTEKLLSNAEAIERQQVNELLDELPDQLNHLTDSTVALQVIISWLESRVEERKSSNGFLRGQLTFCSMLPMRSIPFKVIALLGMNDGEFPKIDRQPTFDLIAQHFRKGDRSRRNDDRYQFLEIILSTRQQLILTYLGQSLNHNEKIPPSVIISELLDVLRESYSLENLTVFHPLHGFSRRYFDGSDSNLRNYSQRDFETALALTKSKSPPEQWWQGKLQSVSDPVIELHDLFSFFRHPQKHFLRRQLAVRLKTLDSVVEEREPFYLERLDKYNVYSDWLHKHLRGETVSIERLKAEGLWLSGVLGDLEFEKQNAEISEFSEKINAKNIGERIEDVVIDLRVDGCRLVGKLSNCYENGGLYYRYTSLKGKDFIGALLHHLVINQQCSQPTYLFSRNDKEPKLDELVFTPKMAQTDFLCDLLEIYRNGLQHPEAFFTEASFAYVKAKKDAMKAAKNVLTYALEQDYEVELRRFFDENSIERVLNNGDFETQCEKFLPIWNMLVSE